MGGHHAPTVLLRQLDRFDGFGDGADLVDLEQQSVTGLLADGFLDALGVGDQQVVAHNLHLAADVGGELGVIGPVILLYRIERKGKVKVRVPFEYESESQAYQTFTSFFSNEFAHGYGSNIH